MPLLQTPVVQASPYTPLTHTSEHTNTPAPFD